MLVHINKNYCWCALFRIDKLPIFTYFSVLACHLGTDEEQSSKAKLMLD